MLQCFRKAFDVQTLKLKRSFPSHLSKSSPQLPRAMSRFATPPRDREQVCRLRSDPGTKQGGISVRFRASVSGRELGELVVQRQSLLKEVAPSLRSCLSSRPLLQISLVRGDAVLVE